MLLKVFIIILALIRVILLFFTSSCTIRLFLDNISEDISVFNIKGEDKILLSF